MHMSRYGDGYFLYCESVTFSISFRLLVNISEVVRNIRLLFYL